ncbi:hypothetical protein LDENG_00260130 [Lucifuga dentata]|nr:hypothetical protein LDENG_00260130 [Lucifuga dentata]
MPLGKLFGPKGKLVLSILLICAVIFELAYCQKDVQKRTNSPGRKAKPSKPKAGKSTNKVSRALTEKPKIKATPAAPAQIFLTQVLGKGKFQKVEETISVLTGDTLELRCRGKSVQWGVPSYLEEDDDGRLSIVQHERYGSLTLVNSTGADTGEYTCYPMYCEDTDCRKEYNKAVKVFVFFPASLGNLRQSSTKYMLIYHNYPMAPPAPVIQASSHSVAVGDDLRVSCTVMGEKNVAIDFTWEYPGQQIGRPLYTQEGISQAGGDAALQQSQSILLVDEVREVDQGKYTCTAQNLQGAKSVSTTVKVTKAKPKKP